MLATAYALAHIAHWLQFSGGEPGGPVRLNARNTRLRRPGGAGGEHSCWATLGSLRTVVRSSSELRLRAC